MINLIIYVICAALILYAAVIYGSVGLAVLSFAACFFVLFAYGYLLLMIFAFQVSLEIPISVAECEQTTEITLKVKNRSFLPAVKLVFFLSYENLLTGEKGQIRLKGASDGKQTSVICAKVQVNHCGKYQLKLRKIRIYDLSGIFYLPRSYKNSSEFYVIPQLYDTAVCVTEASRHFMGEADVYSDTAGGTDASEILQIREFRSGDKIQSIHWKMSAKVDELMVRENRQPIGCPVVLFLDFKEKRKQMDTFLTIAAAVSFALLDQKCAHYVAWYSGREKDVIRLRVDDEETFYLFLMLFYEEKKREKGRIDLLEGYKEKYKAEPYVTEILLKDDLTVSVGETYQKTFTPEKIEQELSGVEFVV